MKRRTFIKLSAISAAGMIYPLNLQAQDDAQNDRNTHTPETANIDYT